MTTTTKRPWWAGDAYDNPGPRPMLTAAGLYLARGWYPIPVARETKKPTLPNWPVAALRMTYEMVCAIWDSDQPPNIGLVTGHGIDVLDVDGVDGRNSLMRYLNGRPFAPSGPTSITGGGGRHLLFRSTGHGNRTSMLPSLDYRGLGGQVIAPPSVHISGRPYRWSEDYDDFLEVPDAPDWLLTLLERTEPYDDPGLRHTHPDHGSVADALYEMNIPFKSEGRLFTFQCPTGRHSDSDWSAKTGLGVTPDRKWKCFGCDGWGDAENIRDGSHVFGGVRYPNL